MAALPAALPGAPCTPSKNEISMGLAAWLWVCRLHNNLSAQLKEWPPTENLLKALQRLFHGCGPGNHERSGYSGIETHFNALKVHVWFQAWCKSMMEVCFVWPGWIGPPNLFDRDEKPRHNVSLHCSLALRFFGKHLTSLRARMRQLAITYWFVVQIIVFERSKRKKWRIRRDFGRFLRLSGSIA